MESMMMETGVPDHILIPSIAAVILAKVQLMLDQGANDYNEALDIDMS